MRPLKFPVIKFTVLLVLGILIGYYSGISFQKSFLACLSFLILLCTSYMAAKNMRNQKLIFSSLLILSFISLGIFVVNIHSPKNNQKHYSNTIHLESNESVSVLFKVKEILKPGQYYDKYVIEFRKINNEYVTGKSLLNIKKDSLNKDLKVDYLVYSKTQFKDLIEPLNPGQFNYKEYLKKKGIYHQLFVDHDDYLILETKTISIHGLASQLRELVNNNLKPHNFNPDEIAIINALLLGQRNDISKEIYTNYAKAGAIHILAVSGLHVGIILLILNFLFKPLDTIKYGRYIKTVIILFLLWSFAVIAGLSPSVTRAVTMFSIVAIGINLKRATNIYNTLAISMFVLLLMNPLFIFDVGFQLSYLAVFSIVWIQPLLYKLWIPKFWILDKFWQIFTVTVAAQFGVAPVSLYYFHQFPGLFFVSNMVIIPVLGIILALGILIVLLSSTGLLPVILAKFYGGVIGLMNDFVTFISEQESFLIQQISFSFLSVIASYIFIMFLIRLYQKFSFKNIAYSLLSVVLILAVLIYNNYENSKNEFMVFHKSRSSIFGYRSDRNLLLHSAKDMSSLKNEKLVIDYKIEKSVKNIEVDSIRSVYKIKDKTILIVDSLGVYKTSFKPDYIILRNSPKINLDRLIEINIPEKIIADGSNYKSYQDRWKLTCLEKEIPFHQTSKKGAFILDLN